MDEPKKAVLADPETPSLPATLHVSLPERVEPPPPPPQTVAGRNDVVGDHTFIADSPQKPPPVAVQDCDGEKSSGTSLDRDVVLARVEGEKRLALIKAWEENEKSKVENKAYKKLSAVDAWENSKKAAVEAQLRQIEEKFERKKAEYAEKVKNKIADIHREAQEKKATVEAERGEGFLKVEETAAKYRARGYIPRNSQKFLWMLRGVRYRLKLRFLSVTLIVVCFFVHCEIAII